MSTALDRLDVNHRAILTWFLDRTGQQIGLPKRLHEVAVVNAQTGIQKPAGWAHAVTVKQTLAGGYTNGMPTRRPDGSWTYVYAKQKTDKNNSQRTNNRALIRCAADDVPVAVIIQTRAKGPALYEVMGLARVTAWGGDSFRLEGYDSAGEIAAATDEPGIPPSYEALDVADWRKRVQREIAVREGGKEFRDNALSDFGERCVISGCDNHHVLQAAHVVPYLGPQTNKRDNALLLRADLHILFDREILQIDPSAFKVRITTEVSTYYSQLDGQSLAFPPLFDRETLGRRLTERAAFLASKAKGRVESEV